ncbi:MAG: hypothetical protein QQN41_11825, partial [Nitrosopumilus sp.]
FPYRMFYAGFISLVLLMIAAALTFKLPFNRVTTLFIIFSIVIFVSGFINGSSLPETLKFLRFVATPFLMYYLVKSYLNTDNIKKVVNLSILLAQVQFPIIIFQKIFYEKLIIFSSQSASKTDFDFGTFYWKDDASMSLFLIFIIIFLLFDHQNNWFIKRKGFKIIWFSITVFLSNAIMGHFVLGAVLIYYILRNVRIKSIIKIAGILGTVTFVFFSTGYIKVWVSNVDPIIDQILFRDQGDAETFLRGGYSRNAAVLYYISRPPKILGDGPSRYFDPTTGIHILGNMGQVFIHYAEVGILGMLLAYMILFSIPGQKLRSSKKFPMFFAICCFTITSSVMSDASMMFAYTIFSSTNLISVKKRRELLSV